MSQKWTKDHASQNSVGETQVDKRFANAGISPVQQNINQYLASSALSYQSSVNSNLNLYNMNNML